MKKTVILLVFLLIFMLVPITGHAEDILPASVNALKFTTSPTFDGNITAEEWGQPTLADVVPGNPPQVYKTDGAPDLTWTAWLRWDSDYFYLALRTPDTKHSNRQEGPALWAGDSVQLKIDPLGNWQSQGQSAKTYVSAKALDVIFARSSIRNANESHCWNTGKEGAIPGIKLGIKNENNITSYEIAIPWTFLNQTVKANDIIGLAIGRLSSSNDADDPGAAYDGCIEWGSGTILNRTDPAACGTNKVTLSNTLAIEPNTDTSDVHNINYFILAALLACTLVVIMVKKEKLSKI